MLEISERAAREILRLDAGRGRWVQVMILGGKCEGFYYHVSWREPWGILSYDHLWEQHGAKVFVDRKSQVFLEGSTLNFDPFKGFTFDNPNVRSSCGCGESVTF